MGTTGKTGWEAGDAELRCRDRLENEAGRPVPCVDALNHLSYPFSSGARVASPRGGNLRKRGIRPGHSLSPNDHNWCGPLSKAKAIV